MTAPTTLELVTDAIDDIAADLGGDPRIRMAIAREFDTILRRDIYLQAQPDDDRKIIMAATPTYMLATDTTMRRAIRTLQGRATRRFPDLGPPNFRGATLRIEPTHVELASRTHGFVVAVAGRSDKPTRWVDIHLTDFGRMVAGLPEKWDTSTSAKGLGGARTALLDLVQTHFGVDLRQGG